MNIHKGNVVVLGAGGHAKVVIATLLEVGYKVTALLDDDKEKVGYEIFHVPVVGGFDRLADYGFCQALIALGDNQKREATALSFEGCYDWVTVVHPTAVVHKSVKIGKGTIVFAGTVIQPDTSIGNHVIINTGATVDHDCRIGNFVHIAPGVHLAGNVSISDGAFLGIGTSVIPGKTIGKKAVVGAGSLVINDIPSFSKVAGVPARPIRKGLI
ncbi:MAG TPA: acetyltransferase [Clostridiaceae bacterium]|nr:acetyltransferase [Clostridiaceae bacterium]